MDEFRDKIKALLEGNEDWRAAFEQTLRVILAHFNSETGAIHLLDRERQLLRLAAQIGVPSSLLEIVRVIPVGKGIAGETVLRGAPVTICNLQQDATGVARPSAKQTGVRGSLCVPLRDEMSIIGTIGIGTVREHQYTADETQLLENIGTVIGRFRRERIPVPQSQF